MAGYLSVVFAVVCIVLVVWVSWGAIAHIYSKDKPQ